MNTVKPGSHDNSRQPPLPDERKPNIGVMKQNADKNKNLPSGKIERRRANHEHLRRAEYDGKRDLTEMKTQRRNGVLNRSHAFHHRRQALRNDYEKRKPSQRHQHTFSSAHLHSELVSEIAEPIAAAIFGMLITASMTSCKRQYYRQPSPCTNLPYRKASTGSTSKLSIVEVLHRPQVEFPAQHSGRIGRTKCLQIKSRRIESGTRSNRFATVEHMLFAVSRRGGEHERTVRSAGVLLKLDDEFSGYRNFMFFPPLRIKSEFRFRAHSHGLQLDVHIAPEEIHHFLFPETGHQERSKQGAFRIGADAKEASQILLPVMSWKQGDAFRQSKLSSDALRP